MNREIWWASLEETGLEHLTVRSDGESFVAESVILRIEDGKPFRLFYRVKVDSAWRVREVEVGLESEAKRKIKLASDGAGNWINAATGNDLPEYAGCFEIDISATPFTNTLAVKRAVLNRGESLDISVVYFLIPEMTVQRSEQRYTRLENDFYRFEENGLFAGFAADLLLDKDDFVVNYPDLFRQIKS